MKISSRKLHRDHYIVGVARVNLVFGLLLIVAIPSSSFSHRAFASLSQKNLSILWRASKKENSSSESLIQTQHGRRISPSTSIPFPTSLFAGNPVSSGGGAHSQQTKFSFSTTREAAIIVEWEPVSELERRIEEGMHYEHWATEYGSQEKAKRRTNVQTNKKRGVFCGYRVTKEEIYRLRSAHPDDCHV